MGSGSVTTEEQELIALNIAIGEAEKQRNGDFLAGVLADDLKFRRANGIIVDKTTYLDGVRDTNNTYDYVHSEGVEAILYENTAVVSLRVRAKGMRVGNPFEGVFRNIRLFLKQPDKQPSWQCHMWFNVRIEDSPA